MVDLAKATSNRSEDSCLENMHRPSEDHLFADVSRLSGRSRDVKLPSGL
jgi:hypothetical protein